MAYTGVFLGCSWFNRYGFPCVAPPTKHKPGLKFVCKHQRLMCPTYNVNNQSKFFHGENIRPCPLRLNLLFLGGGPYFQVWSAILILDIERKLSDSHTHISQAAALPVPFQYGKNRKSLCRNTLRSTHPFVVILKNRFSCSHFLNLCLHDP